MLPTKTPICPPHSRHVGWNLAAKSADDHCVALRQSKQGVSLVISYSRDSKPDNYCENVPKGPRQDRDRQVGLDGLHKQCYSFSENLRLT